MQKESVEVNAISNADMNAVTGKNMFSIPEENLIDARNKWKNEYISAESNYTETREEAWNKYNVDQYVVDAYVFLMCLTDSTARIESIDQYIKNQKERASV